MEIPKFHETFIPILETLSDGNVYPHRKLIDEVIEKYYSKLPIELLETKTKSGEILIDNRIAWSKSYLKKVGYIHYPERGKVEITAKGKDSLHKDLKLSDVTSADDFFDFYNNEKNKDHDTATPQDLIDKGFIAIESQVKNDLLERLTAIDPYYFEKVILILLQKMGYGDFIVTSKSNDGEIDGIINEDKLGLEKIYIQAKRFTENKVREKDIRNFIGAMSADTRKGVFVTTTSFDAGAIKKAHEAHHSIVLIDGPKLVDLMYQYGIGVQVKTYYEIKELDVDFFIGE